MAGELLHLLTLAVALNLGIGALIWFGEPARIRLSESLGRAAKNFEIAVSKQDEQDAETVKKIFDFGLKFMDLQNRFGLITQDFRRIDTLQFKLFALICAGIAFFSCIICTIYYDCPISYVFAILSSALSLFPIVVGIYYYIVYSKFELTISRELQKLLSIQRRALKSVR